MINLKINEKTCHNKLVGCFISFNSRSFPLVDGWLRYITFFFKNKNIKFNFNLNVTNLICKPICTTTLKPAFCCFEL